MRVPSAVVILALLASVAVAAPPKHDPVAVVIIVDRSKVTGDRLPAIKSSLGGIVDGLDAKDRIGVVSFAKDVRIAVAMQSASDRERFEAGIARIGLDNGADLVAALDVARDLLLKEASPNKHVIVVTQDAVITGATTIAGYLLNDRIAVSAIGVQSTNQASLQLFATAGGGDAFVIDDVVALGGIAAREARRPVPENAAYVFVIDTSASMTGKRLELAKAVVQQAVMTLAPSILVGIVAFDDKAHVIIPMERAGNHMRIDTEIAKLIAGGGSTSIFAGLAEAKSMIAGANARAKRIIVISDGDAPFDGLADLLTDARAANIETSAVGVIGADRNLLTAIADSGSGRLYMVVDAGAIPRLVTP